MKNDGRRKVRVTYDIGHIFHKASSSFELIKLLPMRPTKDGKRQARYIVIRCINCGVEREAMLAAMSGNGGCVCRNCGPKQRLRTEKIDHYPSHEEKISIMYEINQIFEEMKQLARQGKLIAYIVKKFDDKNGEQYYMEYHEPNTSNDEINEPEIYDEDVDWDQRINDILDDEKED